MNKKRAFRYQGCVIIRHEHLASMKGKIQNCYILFSSDAHHVAIVPPGKVVVSGWHWVTSMSTPVGAFHNKRVSFIGEDGNLVSACGTCKLNLKCIGEDFKECYHFNTPFTKSTTPYMDFGEFEFLTGRYFAKDRESLAASKNRFNMGDRRRGDLIEKVDLSDTHVAKKMEELSKCGQKAAKTRKYRKDNCDNCFFRCDPVRDNLSDMTITPDRIRKILGIAAEEIYGSVDTLMDMLIGCCTPYDTDKNYYAPMSTHYELARYILSRMITFNDTFRSAMSIYHVRKRECPLLIPTTDSTYSFAGRSFALPKTLVDTILDKTGHLTADKSEWELAIRARQDWWMYNLLSSESMIVNKPTGDDAIRNPDYTTELMLPGFLITLVHADGTHKSESDVDEEVRSHASMIKERRLRTGVAFISYYSSDLYIPTPGSQSMNHAIWEPEKIEPLLVDARGFNIDAICSKIIENGKFRS